MEGLDSLIGHIELESEAQCSVIVRKAAEECKNIHTGYSQMEQTEYWKRIDSGTKEAEARVESLRSLAEAEADKQIQATRHEMIDKAFALAAVKLEELPDGAYADVLKGFKMSPDSSAAELISRYRNMLAPGVASVLFE